MIKSLRVLLFVCFVCLVGNVALTTGCTTSVSSRTAAASTLKIVGLSAKGAIDSAAVLLREEKITRAQWDKVAAFYDLKFQPAFALAIVAAQSDLSSPASADVLALAGQLTALVASFTEKPAAP